MYVQCKVNLNCKKFAKYIGEIRKGKEPEYAMLDIIVDFAQEKRYF